jgi:hypothetical protein
MPRRNRNVHKRGMHRGPKHSGKKKKEAPLQNVELHPRKRR